VFGRKAIPAVVERREKGMEVAESGSSGSTGSRSCDLEDVPRTSAARCRMVCGMPRGGCPHLPFTLLLLLCLHGCGAHSHSRPPDPVPNPGERAQSILVQLAVLNPRVAEPLVKGFSAAALERALGLVVATGVEQSAWAEGLLRHRWWLSEDPQTRLRETEEVREVLLAVEREEASNPGDDGARGREIREALSRPAGGAGGGGGGGQDEATTPGGALSTGPRGVVGDPDPRKELEEAVQWVQFTQAWSSFYSAASASSAGAASAGGPRLALDEAVTMSLVRPDFLDRLAALIAEGLDP